MRERLTTFLRRHKEAVAAMRAWVTGFGPVERRHVAVLGVVAIVMVGFFQYMLFMPPATFPVQTVIAVPEGMTLREASVYLSAHGVVRSPETLMIAVMLLGAEETVKAGDYFFEQPLTVFEVASRIGNGEFGLRPLRVRIPEGSTSYQIAEILEKKLGTIDKEEFIALSKDKEGFLFPDTYFLLPNATPAQIIDIMERNFYLRVAPLEDKIAAFGKPLTEVVTMASLLEKEARWTEERQVISGILWNRIEVNMPLQVDAVFGYIHSTDIYHPKFSDLKVDSPYNTYKNKGLPPGPIASPSLSSIEAAVTPTDNDYLFYLTGRDGKMYYSKTFAEHVDKKYRYLK